MSAPVDIALLGAMEEYARLKTSFGMLSYQPYPKQEEFHALGATHRERLFRAANQSGKTFASANEMAFHLSGKYPDWWRGRRWSRRIRAWAVGTTAEATRDNAQRLLMGEFGKLGSGAIPASLIGETRMARGTADAYDVVQVKHVSGDWSELKYKSFSDGKQKLAGETLDAIWADEEPDEEIYSELLARISATRGLIWISATPLLGMSKVMMRFLMEQSEDRADINMPLDESAHFTDEERAKIIAGYRPHERKARAYGQPMLGEGAIFPVDEEFIVVPRFEIPSWWPQICGLDFGNAHPTAAARLAWDRENDTVYLTQTYRRSRATVEQHAITLRAWGDWLPFAWPKDGLNETAAGPALAQQYRKQGLNMLSEHATHEEGGVSLEAGIQEMLSRMESGRFRVLKGCDDFLSEMRLYHRQKGKVVPLVDDILDAARYALMMLRRAKVKPSANRRPAPAFGGSAGHNPFSWTDRPAGNTGGSDGYSPLKF